MIKKKVACMPNAYLRKKGERVYHTENTFFLKQEYTHREKSPHLLIINTNGD